MIVRERMDDVLLNPENVKAVMDKVMGRMDDMERDKERFYVFGMDTRNRISYVDEVSVGTLNYNIVHPREVFRRAIHRGTASILVAHNHPSGSTEPSDEDRALTQRLVQGGKLLGIEVMDHVIVTREGYTSMRKRGMV